MSAFSLKLLAFILMVIDHIGLVFFPDVALYRLIGRLSFPLFAWTIANGAYHTHNPQDYFMRLCLFAALSQVPYIYMVRTVAPDFWGLNIFFTLAVGFLAITVFRSTMPLIIKLLLLLLLIFVAYALSMDYGAYGVLIIILFYLFFYNKLQLFIWLAITTVSFSVLGLFQHNFINTIRFCGLGAYFFIATYNQKKGYNAQYFFYIAYPLHMVILYLLKVFY